MQISKDQCLIPNTNTEMWTRHCIAIYRQNANAYGMAPSKEQATWPNNDDRINTHAQ